MTLMRQLLTAFGAAMLAVGLAASQYAWAQQKKPQDSRRSMGNLRPESDENSRRSMGNLRPESKTGDESGGTSQVVVPSPHYYRYRYPSYTPGYYPYYYRGGRGYYPYYAPRYPYHWGYRYYGPVFIPAERLYGPRAVMRFMGVIP